MIQSQTIELDTDVVRDFIDGYGKGLGLDLFQRHIVNIDKDEDDITDLYHVLY